MNTTYDAIVIGGSYAGLSAALQLARARRRVLVIDAGERRNRFAAASHGFLTRDGEAAATIAALGREQLLAYPTVTWLDSRAIEARRLDDDGFSVTTPAQACTARRIVLALGVVDELPAIPGLAERWGKTIFHCPYCHGYELDRGPVAVVATHPASHHAAMMLPDWGPTTFFPQAFELELEIRDSLVRRGVTIEPSHVIAIGGDAHRAELHLEDGRTLSFAGLFVLPSTRPAGSLAAQLDCGHDDGPLGPFLTTDASKETTTRGVFACGDAALAMGSVALAVADGVRAGVAAHQSLIFR